MNAEVKARPVMADSVIPKPTPVPSASRPAGSVAGLGSRCVQPRSGFSSATAEGAQANSKQKKRALILAVVVMLVVVIVRRRVIVIRGIQIVIVAAVERALAKIPTAPDREARDQPARPVLAPACRAATAVGVIR